MSGMRIAVSGSHSLGKSTVVNDWVASRSDYIREEEPYRVLGLQGPYEILFREASTRLQNGIQLYYSISRVHRYATSDQRVIFDRAPVDYLAYSQYTANQGATDIDDEFVRMRLASDLEPRGDVIVRKIVGYKVNVPDGIAFPEKVDLELISEWKEDRRISALKITV